MTVIERVAMALCDDTLSRWRSPIALQAEPWREFIPAARAVLQAIREPSERMVEAGWKVVEEWREVDDRLFVTEVLQAMIDAALSE